MNVELRIEELVLHGLPSEHNISDALERELSRLFTERGVPPSLIRGADVPSLDAGAFHISPELGAEEVGAQVARSLYRGLEDRNAQGPEARLVSEETVAAKPVENRTNDRGRIT